MARSQTEALRRRSQAPMPRIGAAENAMASVAGSGAKTVVVAVMLSTSLLFSLEIT